TGSPSAPRRATSGRARPSSSGPRRHPRRLKPGVRAPTTGASPRLPALVSAPPIHARSEAPPRTAGAVLGLARDGRIVAADEAAHGMFGHAPGTLLGMPIAAMLPSPRLAGLLAGEGDGVHDLSLEGRRATAVPSPVEATVRLCAPGGATRALCRLREPERSEL